MTNVAGRLTMIAALTALLALAGCGSGPGTGIDGGRDAGAGAADTGADAGPAPDSGPVPDTGPAPDSSTITGRTVPVGHCGAHAGLYFPEATWIYRDIHDAPLRTNSAATASWLESHGGWGAAAGFQIDTSFYVLEADASTPTHAVIASDPTPYSTDCDPDVLFPVPAAGRIEGNPDYVCPGRVTGDQSDDCHMIVVDFSAHTLFEAYQASFSGGAFYSACNIAWDMTHDSWGDNPFAGGGPLPAPAVHNWGIGQGCTGPDAAGFPIAPLLITVGDVMSGRVEHVIRFALPNDRIQRSAVAGDPHPTWVWPATHAGGPLAEDPDAPIYGGHWRLHDPFDAAAHGLDPTNAVVQAVVYGLQHYGMVLADGGNIPVMAEDDSDCTTTWDDLWGAEGSHVLAGIMASDFDVLETGQSGAGYDCVRNAGR